MKAFSFKHNVNGSGVRDIYDTGGTIHPNFKCSLIKQVFSRFTYISYAPVYETLQQE